MKGLWRLRILIQSLKPFNNLFAIPVFVAKTKQIRNNGWRQQYQILPANSLIASLYDGELGYYGLG